MLTAAKLDLPVREILPIGGTAVLLLPTKYRMMVYRLSADMSAALLTIETNGQYFVYHCEARVSS